jgi:hypothetical protein
MTTVYPETHLMKPRVQGPGKKAGRNVVPIVLTNKKLTEAKLIYFSSKEAGILMIN